MFVHDERYPKVKWTSSINDLIRADFALEDAHATTHITIEDALSHRTGLPRHDLVYGQANDTPSAVTRRAQHLPMTSEPRTTWQYCNIMYAVITDLLETITGSKLDEILNDNFWKPLGMSSTTFTIPLAKSGNSHLARGYYWHASANVEVSSNDKGQYIPEPYIDISPISGAGSTISTVNDFALWVSALLGAAGSTTFKNMSSPISRGIFHDVTTPRAITSEFDSMHEPNNFITPPLYALGWFTTKFMGETLIAHGGGLTGFGTDVYMLPNRGYGIITMANTAFTSNRAGSAIALRLLLQKLGQSTTNHTLLSQTEESLLAISTATLHPSIARHHRRSLISKRRTDMLPTSVRPLPGSIADFAGLYSHPAYGAINLTVAVSQTTPCSSVQILQGLFHPRTWPQKIQLFHVAGTTFNVKMLTPHGLGDIVSGKDIVWEDEGDDSQAVFQFGFDGKVVETMGIEIEESMVEMAREMGEEHWKEGMIWFEKV